MFALIFECGSTTSSWYAELALRRRVRKSAIGSVIVMVTCQPFSPRFPGAYGDVGGKRLLLVSRLPAGLAHARQFAPVCHLPQADPAQAELAVHRVRTPAALAAGVATNLELRLLRGLVDQRLLGHRQFSLNGKP